jgi:nucleotide-binding universal stress UspA family protein
VRVGSPYAEIDAAAKDLRADLICVSTHGRTGLAHLLLGSVAEKVVRHAPCPVLIVPSKPK